MTGKLWDRGDRYWRTGPWIGTHYWFARGRYIPAPPARVEQFPTPRTITANGTNLRLPGERFADCLVRVYGRDRAGVCRVIDTPDWIDVDSHDFERWPAVTVQAQGLPLLVSARLFPALDSFMPVPPRLYVRRRRAGDVGRVIWRDGDKVLGVLMGIRTVRK